MSCLMMMLYERSDVAQNIELWTRGTLQEEKELWAMTLQKKPQ